MTVPVTFRVATSDDIEQLIDLMVVSSWGGIRQAWERVRQGAETWRDRGRAELSDKECEVGYGRFVVADAGGRIAAMALFNLIGSTDDIHPADGSDSDAAALRLIKRSSHSLFVREIATADWARSKGLACELIGLAERIAESNRQDRVTLIVNDANAGAARLYRKLGFHAIAEDASIGHPAFADNSRLLLMEKRVR
jgi:ribosomal protein S18 acetylase RimI-like enzyme